MSAYVCVHGHAYQPPRESPVTGDVERQPSAAPYHDWNERITSECYAPFGRARRLDAQGATISVTNLWGVTSFDLGPTLGVWFDRHALEVTEAVRHGDELGGGAMAHPWVHAILPLTPAGDRATIVRWGADEYRSRFGRAPRGMWLPETAVDTASLEALADVGISWTMVAPHQVRRDDGTPEGAAAGHRPLVVPLPSGRTMTVVPYDGELSHGVAFGGLLDDGLKFAQAVSARAAVAASEPGAGGAPPLVVLSTDIETFGHHHRFGEMALARAVEEWSADADVELITPERYLDLFPATERGRLVERTSWSCVHGIERWRSDCGCRLGPPDDQNQAWRRPLRDILVGVADVCGRLFNQHAARDLTDPWAARYDYGLVLGARPAERDAARAQFVERHLAASGAAERAWTWMEAERLRLEAWSSCAWFFDSPDRIETQQVLVEARAALGRYAELSGHDARPWFDAQVTAEGLAFPAVL